MLSLYLVKVDIIPKSMDNSFLIKSYKKAIFDILLVNSREESDFNLSKLNSSLNKGTDSFKTKADLSLLFALKFENINYKYFKQPISVLGGTPGARRTKNRVRRDLNNQGRVK